MSSAALITRKEAGELLLSLRGLAWLLAMAMVLSAFALLLVSDTELSLLDNAQVVYDMVAIVTALASLLALVIGTDAVAGERERGSLVPLLLTPVSRDTILAGKLGGVAIA
jgi:ABC-type transport system involved in multi-copper enzyme maturation permease subunit